MAARAAQSIRGRLLGFSLKELGFSSSSTQVIQQVEVVDGSFAAVRGLTTSNIANSSTVDAVNTLQTDFGSLGFVSKGIQHNVAGQRFFRVSSVAQEQSLVTTSEELQSGDLTAANTRAMQLKSINDARARIFGHVLGNGERSGHKVLRKKLIGDKIVAWYPTPIQKLDPMFEDPGIKRRQVKLERQKRRGKGPPKKGHGKRAATRSK